MLHVFVRGNQCSGDASARHLFRTGSDKRRRNSDRLTCWRFSQKSRSRRHAVGICLKNSPPLPSLSDQIKSPVPCTTWVVPGRRKRKTTPRQGINGSPARTESPCSVSSQTRAG